MPGGKLIGFAHVQQHIGTLCGLGGFVDRNFMRLGFGLHDQIVGGFHRVVAFKSGRVLDDMWLLNPV